MANARKGMKTVRDLLLIIEGVLIGYLLQIFYDNIREELLYNKFYILSGTRAILTIPVIIFALLILIYIYKYRE